MVNVLNLIKGKMTHAELIRSNYEQHMLYLQFGNATLTGAHSKSSTAPPIGKGRMHCYIKKQLMG